MINRLKDITIVGYIFGLIVGGFLFVAFTSSKIIPVWENFMRSNGHNPSYSFTVSFGNILVILCMIFAYCGLIYWIHGGIFDEDNSTSTGKKLNVCKECGQVIPSG